ncbi:unnamed protein product [Blepharisma stoltei]|uniref:Uncharacterized protein n=1 Tax=Blepharisma stoltei TaxID=1481888 RepID=A0AAU9JT96_9CILI|nr:unnamed protein product [Blepharisma stoltei]
MGSGFIMVESLIENLLLKILSRQICLLAFVSRRVEPSPFRYARTWLKIYIPKCISFQWGLLFIRKMFLWKSST